MKKFFVLLLVMVFGFCAPVLARTKYDKYGHKIEPKKRVKVQAAAKADNKEMLKEENTKQADEEKVKEKNIIDARGRNLGRAVRDGDTNNFTMYDQRGRKTGTYVEDEEGNGKYYDVRGREVTRSNRQTQDIK